jgi:serine/threonine protein kinase
MVYEGLLKCPRTQVAIKVVNIDNAKTPKKRTDLITCLYRECEVLQSLSHPGVMKILDKTLDGSNFYMVLECAHGGTVFERMMVVKRFKEAEARIVFHHIVQAVHYIHGQNIVHRDLKPENILFKSRSGIDQVLLCDFMYACPCLDDTLSEQLGTPNYVAPEVLLRKPYGKSVDAWALGVLLYILLSGNFPFNHSDQNTLFRLIVKNQYSFAVDKHKWEGVSEEAKELIRKILVLDVAQRYTTADMLADPWMQSYQPEAEAEEAWDPSMDSTVNTAAYTNINSVRSLRYIQHDK